MLRLTRTDERLRMVCSTDESVHMEEEDRDPVRWMDEDSADVNGAALVAIVRPLSSREFLRLQARASGGKDPEVALVISAAEVGTVAFIGPDVDISTPSAVLGLLDQIGPAELAALGARVIDQTILDPDERPTSAAS